MSPTLAAKSDPIVARRFSPSARSSQHISTRRRCPPHTPSGSKFKDGTWLGGRIDMKNPVVSGPLCSGCNGAVQYGADCTRCGQELTVGVLDRLPTHLYPS